ncbi:energy-coupling factor transporter ATPase [Alteribacter lacisalsi]|uniref:Energy-coupling factor transporter ATP-binding protein EcfA2 n=1 Tax=Alteribacter lacisalsi TaxID=2045244 RepID=A0A2W0H4T2_9BACI|nr:energy-coupling factor transporter ATPase [Alteribacter lacisalsi]PYZ95626.1 energy-coupling factor transporter ATPase [Alteribacter lacisalsi]
MHIKAQDLGFIYGKGTPFEKKALSDVNVDIPPGSRVAVVGHTGSGKSTLVQHLNGLLIPTEGSVTAGEVRISPGTKQKELYRLRRRVGMVFQYPEHQLFEETVEKDISFAPRNFGVKETEIRSRIQAAVAAAGLDDSILERSPFELSGGQMRRVAIAGVLAGEPDVLILDEPAAGLDPKGRRQMMKMFSDWQKAAAARSYILVTHHMEDAAKYADFIYVMNGGTVVMEGQPSVVFLERNRLLEIGLDVPMPVRILMALGHSSPHSLTTYEADETAAEIVRLLRGEGASQ